MAKKKANQSYTDMATDQLQKAWQTLTDEVAMIRKELTTRGGNAMESMQEWAGMGKKKKRTGQKKAANKKVAKKKAAKKKAKRA